MPIYRTILADIDGSDVSDIAVDRAADIARVSGADLVLVHAYDASPMRDSAAIGDILKADAYQICGSAPAEAVLRAAEERAAACGVRSVMRRAVPGPPAAALLAVAAETDADLLVIADRGKSTAIGRRFGTLSDEVAQKSRTDVLVVYPKYSHIRSPHRCSEGSAQRGGRSAGRSLLRTRLLSRWVAARG